MESVSKPIQTLQRLGSNAIDMGSSFSFQNHDSSSLHSYYRVSQSYTWHSFFSIYVHYFSVSKQKFLRLLLLLLLLVPLLFRNFIFPQQQQRISTIIGCGLWNQETNIWNTHTQKPKKKEEATTPVEKQNHQQWDALMWSLTKSHQSKILFARNLQFSSWMVFTVTTSATLSKNWMSWRSAGSFSVRHHKICPCCCNSDPITRIPRISQERHQITTRIAVTSHHIQSEAGAWKSHIEQIYISMTSCFKSSPYYKYNFKIPIRAAAIWVLKAKSGFSLLPMKANPNSFIHYCQFLGFKGFEVGSF